jgi:hypothetical protein
MNQRHQQDQRAEADGDERSLDDVVPRRLEIQRLVQQRVDQDMPRGTRRHPDGRECGRMQPL